MRGLLPARIRFTPGETEKMSRIKPYYEEKFPVSSRQRLELLQELAPVIITDSHGQNGNYQIFSQYFDTPDLQFFQDKVNGEFLKTKVRLRFYRSYEQPIWHFPCLEIKQRRGNIVSKHRFKLDLKLADSILRADRSFDLRELILASCQDAEIRSSLGNKVLVPAVAVFYRRAAFHVRGLEGLRLTFDREIAGLTYGRLCDADGVLTLARAQHQRSSEIFEIKSYARPPAFIVERLAALGAVQQSFSKYAFALQSLNCPIFFSAA